MPRERRSAMEKLPFKPSPMELEHETACDFEWLGWKDAPSRYWPIESAASFDLEPNCPANFKKISQLETAMQKLMSLT